MLNKVMLIGNLGRDPEIRSTPSGQTVATFSVATNRKWKDRDGNRQEETEWHNIDVWGRQAEIAGQYLRRGSKVFIEGRIKTESWDDRETGAKRYKTKIVCENFKMLDSRGAGGSDFSSGEPAAGGYSSGPAQNGGTPGGPAGGPDDDDIPF
jgi:single-strand DNA-binding protein